MITIVSRAVLVNVVGDPEILRSRFNRWQRIRCVLAVHLTYPWRLIMPTARVLRVTNGSWETAV